MRAMRTTLLLSALVVVGACQRGATEPEPPIVEVIVEVELDPESRPSEVLVTQAPTREAATTSTRTAARDKPATLRAAAAKPDRKRSPTASESTASRVTARPSRRRAVPTADDVCVQLMTLAGIAEPRTRTEKWTVCVDEVRGIEAACSAASWAEVSTCVLFAEDLRELAACSGRDLCKLPGDGPLGAHAAATPPSM
ncbi:MAG: hypothetical protein KC486_31470 [Myxococcales bacterium]|nr:hypothetical protein [Myxococcales bacterium]